MVFTRGDLAVASVMMDEVDERDEPHTEFIYCCGAATELLKFGARRLTSAHKLLFIVIPGNPGVVGFYRTFMQTIHRQCGYKHPVWAVSHAGHCVPPASMDLVEDASSAADSDVFGLKGQIEHKVTFIRRHVPPHTRLVLLGHSIGCYIILDLIRRQPELNVVKAVLLFPTIERMAQTPQGKVMTPVLCQLRYLAYLPLFLLSLLPERIKAGLVRLVLGRLPCLDPAVLQPTVELLAGDCAANAMYMGGQEMRKVLQRDNVAIKENLDKLIFYYGATDHWCPVQFYQDMKLDFPQADLRLCERGIRHAFVLDAASQVAHMVVQWLAPHLTV